MKIIVNCLNMRANVRENITFAVNSIRFQGTKRFSNFSNITHQYGVVLMGCQPQILVLFYENNSKLSEYEG